MTKISIIIPVYNAESYLEECLNSIICQDLEDIEIICVNDGSTDNSALILENYTEKDPRIINITQINGGVSQARNLGLKQASGDFILFVDADDFLAEHSLKYLYDCTKKNDLDILVFGYYHLLNDNISVSAFVDIWKNKLPAGGFSFNFEDSFLLNGSIWNKLISKELIKKSCASFPKNISYAEDTIFCFQLYPFVHKMQIIPECFYFYRNREEDSLSCRQDVFKTLYNLFPQFIENVPNNQKMAAMNYWCNFFTWNLLKKKKYLTVNDLKIVKEFLSIFDNINTEDKSSFVHYNRLLEEFNNFALV